MKENLLQVLLDRYAWRPIPGCRGRYTLRGGVDSRKPEELCDGIEAGREQVYPGAADPVRICTFPGGGLISYRKRDGYLHTLCDEEGLKRKIKELKKGGEQ